MRIEQLDLEGAYRIVPEKKVDERGRFFRVFCEQEFAAHGLVTQFVQSSMAQTIEAGTVRGLHYQRSPNWETKLVRCTRGAAMVVLVDLRAGSSTCGGWVGVELTQENSNAVYVPKGFAQGYQTMMDDTEMLYQMDVPYCPESSTGLSCHDSAFSIDWPLPIRNLSERDRSWPRFEGVCQDD
jgi:dTDP-4-dehydrorhamnose 3,5-epimerase